MRTEGRVLRSHDISGVTGRRAEEKCRHRRGEGAWRACPNTDQEFLVLGGSVSVTIRKTTAITTKEQFF